MMKEWTSYTCQNKQGHRFPWRIELETYLMLISQYLRAEYGYRLSHVIILLKPTLLPTPFGFHFKFFILGKKKIRTATKSSSLG